MPLLVSQRDGQENATTRDQRIPLFGSHTKDRGQAAMDILLGGCPGTHADSHRCAAMPHRSAAPASAILLDGGDHSFSLIVTAERDKHLIKDNLVENLAAGRAQTLGELRCIAASTLDKISHS